MGVVMEMTTTHYRYMRARAGSERPAASRPGGSLSLSLAVPRARGGGGWNRWERSIERVYFFV
jgi:hypothetical protein